LKIKIKWDQPITAEVKHIKMLVGILEDIGFTDKPVTISGSLFMVGQHNIQQRVRR